MITQSLQPDEPVEARLTESLLSAYIQSMHPHLSAHSIHNQLVDLSQVFKAMCPAQDWSWIRKHRNAPTMREVRASKKLIEPPDPVKVLAAAMAHCDQALKVKTSFRRAQQYRDGMMMIILLEHAMRLKNFSEMKIGEHLLVERTHFRINFETSVKNNEIIDCIVADQAAKYLGEYLSVHRPVLLKRKADHGALWVNIDGDPLSYTTVGQRIRMVSQRLGHPMSPHDARYALATTLLIDDPRNVSRAAAALAHRGNRSVNSVYDQSGSQESQAYWMRLLKKKSAG